jgi:hypothetical protein
LQLVSNFNNISKYEADVEHICGVLDFQLIGIYQSPKALTSSSVAELEWTDIIHNKENIVSVETILFASVDEFPFPFEIINLFRMVTNFHSEF